MRASIWRGRLGLVLAWVVVLGLQVGLLAYFGGSVLLESKPVAGLDFDTHIAQVWRVLEGLEGWGKSWVYDVQHLAGYPNGTIFDADNKGWEIWTWVLVSMGMEPGLAFNTFVLACHLSLVPIVYASARLFRLGPWASLGAAALAVGYWNFDSWAHWCWYVGMVAYGFASFATLLPLALMYRWLEERKTWQGVAMVVTLGACHLLHPYSFLILAVPMIGLYVRAIRRGRLDRAGHLWVVGAAVFTLGLNAYWLSVAFSFWHYILDSSLFAETGIISLPFDVFALLRDPASTGIVAKRTAWRMLMMIAAVATVVLWRRRGDDRALPFGLSLGTLAAFAYLGGHTFLNQVQPYRHVFPLGFVSAIATAALVEFAVRERLWRSWPGSARVATGLLCVPLVLYLAQDVLYFMARSLPKVNPLPHGERIGLSALGHAPHSDYSYGDGHAEQLAAFVREHDDGSSRWLVEGWSWGEQLTWKTDAQVIGGFIWRNLQHSWSNFFRQRPQGVSRPAELEAYARRYAVGWVVISTPRTRAPWWDASPVLELVKELGPFRIYRTRIEPRLIEEGPGEVRAQTNRIEVTGTDPNREVVLRYHWLETLVCEPDCRIGRKKVEHDPVGFIVVPAPHPEDFVIANQY